MRIGRTDPVPEIKRQLAAQLVRVLDGWSQPIAADSIEADCATVSRLRNGRLERYSVDTLLRFLANVDRRVVFTLEWTGKDSIFTPPPGVDGRPARGVVSKGGAEVLPKRGDGGADRPL
jgi:predicted XRE-type DNA-binding protein